MTNWGKDKLMTVHEQDPFNAEAPGGSLATLDTAVSAFYSRNHGPIPDLDPSTFVLTVDGLVGTPLALSMQRLRAEFDVVTERATLQCAGNRRADLLAVADIPGEDPWGPGAISTATWTGVRLADVLAAAGVTPEAAHVEFLAPDVSQIADPPAPTDPPSHCKRPWPKRCCSPGR